MGPLFSRLHALAIHNRCTGAFLPSLTLSHTVSKDVMDPLPSPILSPLPEVHVDRRVRWKVVRKHAPGAAAAKNVEDGVDHRPQICASRSTTGLGCRKQTTEALPFRIAKVAWVSHRRILTRFHGLSKHPLTAEDIEQRFTDPCLALSFTSTLKVISDLKVQITTIEKAVLKQSRLRPDFQRLLEIPGIGQTLALTIMYEAGSIARFADVGHFCSYCRCVPSKHLSNGKVKGSGNVKNGNPYLSWAFTEAAHFLIRFEPRAKRYYERKSAKTNPILALRAVANKTARAVFYVLHDQVPFRVERAFG